MELPNCKDAEMMVLGTMIQRPDCFVKGMEFLQVGDFFFSEHKLIFNAMQSLEKADFTCEVASLALQLRGSDQLKSIGGISYLTSLCQFSGYTSAFEEYLQIARNHAMLRSLAMASTKVLDLIKSGSVDVSVLLDQTQKELMTISLGSVKTGAVPLDKIWDGTQSYDGKSLMDDLLARQDRNMRRANGLPVPDMGIMTGFHDIDNIAGELSNGNLIIVGARAGMGKTAFGLNIAAKACIERRKKVLFFSLEMTKEQLSYRLISYLTMIEANRLLSKNVQDCITAQELEVVRDTTNIINASDFFIEDTPGININQVRSISRRVKETNGLDLIVIDYLGLISGVGKQENRQAEVAQVSRNLKILAKELHVPVIALAQLNREAEKHGQPMMRDLRESGQIEQDADLIIMLHRREYYDPSDKPGHAQAYIVKNRHGPTGMVELNFQGQFYRFNSLAKIQKPEGYE